MHDKSISLGGPNRSFHFLSVLGSLIMLSCSDGGTDALIRQEHHAIAPTIVSVLPESAYVGDIISIRGTRFAASAGISSITIGGATAMPTLWTDTLLTVIVPPTSANGQVNVAVNGVSSNTMAFQIMNGTAPQTPLLMSISPDSSPIGGTVTLNGDFVSNGQGSSQVLCQNTPATVQSWNSSQITFTAPDWIGDANVVVRVGGRSSNALSLRIVSSTSAPFTSSITPTSGRPGDVLMIEGTGFDTIMGSVTINGVVAAISNWTATSVTAIVPAHATTGLLIVHTPNSSSNGVQFTVLPDLPPTITSLSPDSGIGGTDVTISGSQFGSQQGTSIVTFNGVTATVSTWSAGTVIARVPGNATTGNVSLTVAGQVSNGVLFRVVTATGSIPTITEVDPNPSDLGERIRIHGTNFGPETPVVKINEVTIAPDEWRSDEIRFYIPSNAVTGNLVVTVGGRSSAPVWFVLNGTVPGGLSLSTTGISVQTGTSGAVTISGGTQPYTLQTLPNSAVATASLEAATITVSGVSIGSTSLVVRDNASPTPNTATLSIGVNAAGSGTSFSQHIQPIFNANCTGCHGGSGGLTLTAGQSYSNLVNVQAQAGCITENRVMPGSANSSVLYKRLSGTSCGERMPRGGNALSAADIQRIMDWINQGALNN